MRLIHIALWTNDLERSRDFYVKYFNGKSNDKYVNLKKGFSSYFVVFEGGASLEIMKRLDITDVKTGSYIGLAHFAFSVGTKEKVDEMTEILRRDKYQIFSEPRITGDGFYEAAFMDPDGNIVEIVA
ncbi:VOC family protein [Parabacteroides sp. AM08-6]|uniref:VOC family protein n=1 Tax=Parabacteroides sp. AM08-6 TaxID=2292053 RepID=UPI000F007BA5|nr:VOC family protein [Parabacteroides sp. AM08-6]RHJ86459.1 glyoxalase/bleomycin resistance/extradiol dioxygenase family protein [Parabacteroides sp. AM08-6]